MRRNIDINREILVNNTKIIKLESNIIKLELIESLLIRKNDPQINRQDTGKVRVLKL